MTTSTAFEKSICYDRETKDFRAELNGDLVGFFGGYHAAEVELDRVAYELATEEGVVSQIEPEPTEVRRSEVTVSGERIKECTIPITSTSTVELVKWEPHNSANIWSALLVDGRHYNLVMWKFTLGRPEIEVSLQNALAQVQQAIAVLDDDTVPPAEPDSTPATEGPSPLRAPVLYCPLCLCVVDHVGMAAWLCRNDRCLARYPDTQQLLTQSELIERRRIAIDLASGVCPNCGDAHHPQSCSEIRQAIDGGDHRLTLGRTLCRLRWRNYARFVVLISHIPAWQIGMYAESYVAYIQSYSPRPTSLTAADVLKAWAKLIHPDGPAAPAMHAVGQQRLAA